MLSPNDKKFRAEYKALQDEKKKASADEASKMKELFKKGVYTEKDDPKPKAKVFDSLPPFDPSNPQTFFDIEIGNPDEEKTTGRVVFEVFTNTVPKTAENFRSLCVGG